MGQMTLEEKTTLNLGCGRKPDPNAVNVDITPDTKPDVVHDLNVFPWPFPDNRFEKVVLWDVIEHLDSVLKVMEEVHRISRPGAVLELATPHFSCSNSFTDPTHRHHFGCFSLDYFTGTSEHSYYTRTRYKLLYRWLYFRPGFLKRTTGLPSPINAVILRLANRYPKAYEEQWAWMFPAWYLAFKLEVVK